MYQTFPLNGSRASVRAASSYRLWYALRFGSCGAVNKSLFVCVQTDEELLVWMREASGPTFTKLHRRIEGLDLKKGDNLTIFIGNSTRASCCALRALFAASV